MPSTWIGYEIGYSALQTNQNALDVIGNNVANLNTPDYSRQVAVLTENTPSTALTASSSGTPGQLGTGVDVSTIERIRDNFADQQVWLANSAQSSASNTSTILNQVQDAYNEPSSAGISEQMTAFFNSFSTLSANPQSAATRATVLNAGQSLVTAFHSVSSALSQISPEITQKISGDITTVNTLAGQIANLNQQITLGVASGNQPNDLEDQRSALLNQLSNLVNIQVTNATNPQTGQSTGAVEISVGGYNLVQGAAAQTLPATTTTVNGNPGLVTASGVNIPLAGGEIYGLLQAGTLVQGYQSDLDTVASNLVTAVNTISAAGVGLDGSTGNLFFTNATGSPAAAAISINPAVAGNLNKIAAASAPIPPNTFAAGNGDNASLLAALTSTPVVNGQSLNDFYNSNVATIGADAQTYQAQSTNQQTILSQAQNLQSSISGVNLDEELTNMMTYQRAYQAAARVLNTADDFVQDVINGLGGGTALA